MHVTATQLWKVHTECMSESVNSPPLLCCCGSWAGFSTRRLCPMIQPPRGLYLSCTQGHPRYTGQLHLPNSFTNSPGLLYKYVLLLCVILDYLSSTPFSSVHPLVFLPAISLRPSLPPGVGLPLPLAPWPSLLGSFHRSAFTERCLPFLRESMLCFQFNVCAVVCGAMCVYNNACPLWCSESPESKDFFNTDEKT